MEYALCYPMSTLATIPSSPTQHPYPGKFVFDITIIVIIRENVASPPNAAAAANQTHTLIFLLNTLMNKTLIILG
ncbi:hypothetical protein DMENIID0001_033350 [Sergentomyia squamirostris]